MHFRDQVHGPCGGHVSEAYDDTHVRWVEHEGTKCLDCEAIRKAREQHHAENRHDSDKVRCDCDDLTFFIQRREPLPEHMRPPRG